MFQQKVNAKQVEIEDGFKQKQSDDPEETLKVIQKDFDENKD